MPLQHAVLKCVAIGVAYVAPFYCRGSHARDHPSTIMFRMTSTVATSLLAWFPLYHQVYNKVQLLTGVLHVPFTRCIAASTSDTHKKHLVSSTCYITVTRNIKHVCA